MKTIHPEQVPHDGPLDAETLRKMIGAGESLHVEFKSDVMKHEKSTGLSDDDVADAVVCLANKDDGLPGWLLVGVENNRTLCVSRSWGRGKSPRQLEALIRNRTIPSVRTEVQDVAIDGSVVTAVRVYPANVPTCTSKGRYLKRTIGANGKPACESLSFAQLQSMSAARGDLEFGEVVANGVQLSDLNPLEFERFRQRVSKTPERADQALLDMSNEDLCRSLKAVEYDAGQLKVRTLGLLLFGHEEMIEEMIPTHRIAYQIASGNGVHWNEIRHWPLIHAMDELENMLTRTEHEDEILFGVQRVGLPQYHPASVREAVANALIHRDYFRRGTVQVRWLAGNFDVSSPGEFPAGVSYDSFLVNGSKPRNALLLSAFKRCGIVDEIGRGIRRIFEQQLLKGRPCPVFQPSAKEHVILRMDNVASDFRLVRLARHEDLHSQKSPLDTLLVLQEILLFGEVDLDKASSVTQLDKARTVVLLGSLVERGMLRKVDRTPHVWKLSTRSRNVCNHPLPLESSPRDGTTSSPAPVSDDALYIAQILQHVAVHKTVSRRDVVGLCGVSARYASKLLSQLTKSGALVKHGQRRFTWYSLP